MAQDLPPLVELPADIDPGLKDWAKAEAHQLAVQLESVQLEADSAGAVTHLLEQLSVHADRFQKPDGTWARATLQVWCRVVMRSWLVEKQRARKRRALDAPSTEPTGRGEADS